ncbi:peptidoglycan-binding protein [Ancylobacter lacus]|uniref:peptidoglycan-binding protein n=1 Tax=Ancylobacter lacus TaxID=2579970 RepID=UPI001BD0F17E|nr:peptidoglycan-binding protein [Ancylobacter lacus]MBS7540041.1 peptidoglycan-binding protein [Ancylobacter lacus]
MLPVDAEFIRKVAPRFSGKFAEAQAAIISAIGPALAATLERYDIGAPLRIAHFMGQVTHECAGFRTTQEFASGAAYEGRRDLGNTEAGDGRRFKGRGLLQLTGRANYKAYGEALGIDLVGEPERAAEPVLSLVIACEYWKRRGINKAADADDLVTVTRLVNGGQNGLDERGAYLRKAKAALAEMRAVVVAAQEGGLSPVLRRGSRDDAVGELQRLLRARDYPVAVDTDFGAATELAVIAFQRAQRLEADGIVGRKTWEALRA